MPALVAIVAELSDIAKLDSGADETRASAVRPVCLCSKKWPSSCMKGSERDVHLKLRRPARTAPR